MKSYTYEVVTHNRGTIFGTVDANTIKEATGKVKGEYPRFTRLKIEEESDGAKRV